MKYLKQLIVPVLLVGLTIANAAMAEEADQTVEQTIRKALQPLLAGGKIDLIRPSEMAGMYEVVVGTNLYYASKDGRYLFNGSMLDLRSGRNLTEIKKSGLRMGVINSLGEDQMIIFAASKVRHTITVFTDLDCPYCRLMHSKIKGYNDRGITVRYLLYPRDVVGSPSYKKAVSVWCSKDKNQAFTDASQGKPVASLNCENPVQSFMSLGKQMGVSGTPTIFLETGDRLPGYVPPAELASRLEQNSKLEPAATDSTTKED
ncbi:MAG TPA: DsbC family protein [Gammaproteobacteria bacterium]|nr:DsbC family protein [Gammaproteobacteria bacterium]